MADSIFNKTTKPNIFNLDAQAAEAQSQTDVLTGGPLPPDPLAHLNDDLSLNSNQTVGDDRAESVFTGPIGPFPNSFKKFATMTYSASIYIQSPAHYNAMMKNGDKNVRGLALLIQSGGIAQSGESLLGAHRSEDFPNDLYLDNIQLESWITGQATGHASNAYKLNFTVTEPAGITFIESLNRAVTRYAREQNVADKNITFETQSYLMVIRFYGYDEQGIPISGGDTTTSASAANMEKYIPFTFESVQFQLRDDKVEYKCTAVTPESHIGSDRIHGIIPFNMGIQGQTLDQLFNGKTATSNSGGLTTGLMPALNDFQRGHYKNGHVEIPDEYEVKFEEGMGFETATVAQPGTTSLHRSGMPIDPKSADYLKEAIGSSKVKKKDRTFSVTGGMRILHFLDLAIRTSSYITDQYVKAIDENTQKVTGWKQKDPDSLDWFKIRPEIIVNEKYDNLRNSYAYKIIFHISKYTVDTVQDSAFFEHKRCLQIHKEYDFWFTGNNTEVTSFSQDYNAFYFSSFGRTQPSGTRSSDRNVDGNTLRGYANTVSETNRYGENNSAEQAASAASILYSPEDQAKATIDIVGDPDWISQSGIFYVPTTKSTRGMRMLDGSLNYDATEIFFTINYNTIVDYNPESGIADVNALNNGQKTQYSIVYRATKVISQLAAGKFTQRIEARIKDIPKECIINKDVTSSPNESSAEIEPERNDVSRPTIPATLTTNNSAIIDKVITKDVNTSSTGLYSEERRRTNTNRTALSEVVDLEAREAQEKIDAAYISSVSEGPPAPPVYRNTRRGRRLVR